MTEASNKQLRVLHVVSAGAISTIMQQWLLMPVLTRLPKTRIKTQVISLAPGFAPAAVLRQNGVPVHDVAFSRKRFAFGAPTELLSAARQFRPDIIHAWGHTAQLVALALAARCDWEPHVVWNATETAPLPKHAGIVDKQKLKLVAKYSKNVDRLIFTSDASIAMHRRVDMDDSRTAVIAPGLDPTRFKPDLAVRRKVRQQLNLPGNAVVIGMVAPFLPDYDHNTFFQGVGELIKSNPNVHVLLAGHGVQRGNAPLMAMVGGGTLGTRTQLLSDWSDLSSLFNACDIACSSARTDAGRMSLIMAMLCGVPCVATGMGAQGEAIGQFGAAIEPGSATALIRGFKRVLEMPADRKAFMLQGARKHALEQFTTVRSLQKYLQVYFDLAEIKEAAADVIATPQIDASIPTPEPEAPAAAPAEDVKAASSTIEWQDPDSLEVKSRPPVRAPEAAKPVVQEGDVLELFETNLASGAFGSSRTEERARGAVDEGEVLLEPEMLQSPAPEKDVVPAIEPETKRAAAG